MESGLYVVGTPIGNLEDLSPRARATLGGADAILAEDTRVTQKLLARFELHTPLISCHRFNEAGRVAQVTDRIASGQALALVTDSGMPGVSDPGARVVAACRDLGLPVFVVPGPSSVTAAVALSGFESYGFHFGGFLPHKSGARRRRLEEMASLPVPVVLFESPFRFLKLLDEVEEIMPGRALYAGRELTKKFEESRWGTAAALRAHYADRALKGEFVVVIAPAEAPPRRREREGYVKREEGTDAETPD